MARASKHKDRHSPNQDLPLRLLVHALVFVCIVPLSVLLSFTMLGVLDFSHFLMGCVVILILSAFLLRPYLQSLNHLAQYLLDLAEDKRVEKPDISPLRTLGDLPGAMNRLYMFMEQNKQQMESVIDEREILVDSIPDILVMVDSSLTIVRTNAAARNVFGQNLAHRKLEEVVHNASLIRAVREAYEGGEDKDVEFELTSPVDAYYRARIDHFPVRSSGGIAVIITLHDITELKRSEQMRADFVANASHEIRTPLASLVGFIETLQGPAKEDEKAREQFLSIMAEQATRMSALVNDLLSLSKIEMNASTQPKGSVDMARIVTSVKEQCQWSANEKKMVIELDLPSHVPPVRGEESELMQVIYNLVTNAIKYGKEATPIIVTVRVAKRVPIDRQIVLRAPALCVSVKDQGDGIAKEHLPRLTERFYRVNNAASRKIGGTGLGLAIVKHILHRHRGLIEVDSTVGVGSDFKVYLPLSGDASRPDQLLH